MFPRIPLSRALCKKRWHCQSRMCAIYLQENISRQFSTSLKRVLKIDLGNCEKCLDKLPFFAKDWQFLETKTNARELANLGNVEDEHILKPSINGFLALRWQHLGQPDKKDF